MEGKAKMRLIVFLLWAGLLSAQTADWSKPEFWGLKPGSYIPTSANCMGGTFATGHNRHKQFDFEVCADITYTDVK